MGSGILTMATWPKWTEPQGPGPSLGIPSAHSGGLGWEWMDA